MKMFKGEELENVQETCLRKMLYLTFLEQANPPTSTKCGVKMVTEIVP